MVQNVTTEDLQKALQNLAAKMGLNVHEYVKAQGFANEADVASKFSEVQGKLDSILKIDPKDNVESIAEKINSLKNILDADEGSIQKILDESAKHSKAIADIQKSFEGKVAAAQTKIESISTEINTINGNVDGLSKNLDSVKGSLETFSNGIEKRMGTVEAGVKTLTADASVAGSVANMMKTEADRAKASEVAINKSIETAKTETLESAKSYSDSAIKEAVAKADITKNPDFISLQDKVGNTESILNDTVDAKGNLEKGVVSKVSDLEKGLTNVETVAKTRAADVLKEAKDYVESNMIKGGDLNISNIINVFVQGLSGKETKPAETKPEAKPAETKPATSSNDGAVL